MVEKFKTRDEYCHIFEDKLVITRTPEIVDLVEDYAKSVNNVYAQLMAFFVIIPIFSALSVVTYNMGNWGVAIYSEAITLFFITLAFNTMFFISGSPLIKRVNISKIKIQERLFNTLVVIYYKEFGRQKKRHLILEKEQVGSVSELLLSQNLIEDKKIDSAYIYDLIPYLTTFSCTFPMFTFIGKGANSNIQSMMTYYGCLMLGLVLFLLIRMIKTRFNTYHKK